MTRLLPNITRRKISQQFLYSINYKLHVLDITCAARNQECKRPISSSMKCQLKENRRRLDGTMIMYRETTLQLTAITDDVGKKEKLIR